MESNDTFGSSGTRNRLVNLTQLIEGLDAQSAEHSELGSLIRVETHLVCGDLLLSKDFVLFTKHCELRTFVTGDLKRSKLITLSPEGGKLRTFIHSNLKGLLVAQGDKVCAILGLKLYGVQVALLLPIVVELRAIGGCIHQILHLDVHTQRLKGLSSESLGLFLRGRELLESIHQGIAWRVDGTSDTGQGMLLVDPGSETFDLCTTSADGLDAR
jgi:hypothetical protein